MMRRLKVISLFTGAGGLDLGFEAAGLETSVAVEMDPCSVATLRLNRSWPVIDRDVATVSTAELLAVAQLAPDEADVLIGGPPCQPFSKSGYWARGAARRMADPRAATIDHYLRVLAEARPKAFLLENVEGFGFRGKDEGLARVQDALDEINRSTGTRYRAHVATLNAVDFGVPQLRRRLFVVGSRDGVPFSFPKATHLAPSDHRSEDDGSWRTAWDALHDLPKPNDPALAVTGKWAALLPSIPEGQNYLYHTDRGAGEDLFGWRRRYWSFLLKLSKGQPAWTIQAQPGPATGPFHWSSRRLSMREMARLQTFPDNFWVSGSYADAQRQLGNAVPALLGEVLARSISQQLLGRRKTRHPFKLQIAKAAALRPRPETPCRVPVAYLALRGAHDPHPGTGKGYRALHRAVAESQLLTSLETSREAIS